MNCVNHADVEANAFCNQCGKALCEPCVRQVRNSVYCENCLAESIGGDKKTATKSTQRAGGTSPEAAFVLGLIPGVGAIYNGEFFKAALHVFIWATLITLSGAVRVGGTNVEGMVAVAEFLQVL